MKNKNVEPVKRSVPFDEYAATMYSNELAMIIKDLEHLSDQTNKTLRRITATLEEVRSYKEKLDNNIV